MIDPPLPGGRGTRLAAIAFAVLVVAGLAAGGAALIAQRSGTRIALPVGSTAPTTAAGTLRRAVEVRAGAAPDTAIVTQLPAGSAVRLLGRSVDSTWVVVTLENATDVVGWVPADAVEGLRDPGRLPVVTDASTLAAAATVGTSTLAALPDLRIESASSKGNRLTVTIVNDGPGDLPTPLLVAVNDSAPVRLEAAAGSVLRAKQRVEAVVPGEFVQLRARITLRVQTEPANRETNVENNAWSGIVEPDLANNLGIASAVADGTDRHLVVTVRNDSLIPVRGSITITVREALPSTTLLGRDVREVRLDPGKTIDIPFAEVRQADPARLAIRLSTDAIHDAVLADDSFPR